MVKEGLRPENIFIDAGVSGTVLPENREGYSRMIRFIESNQEAIEHLYVFEITRLGRSFLDTLARILEFEKERGIRVWSLSPQESWTRIDNQSIRELMLAIFFWVAERERENLIERTRAGQERARAEGKHCGRPRRQINWRKVDENLAKGLSLSAVSRLMDIPYSTLLRQKADQSKGTKLGRVQTPSPDENAQPRQDNGSDIGVISETPKTG